VWVRRVKEKEKDIKKERKKETKKIQRCFLTATGLDHYRAVWRRVMGSNRRKNS